MSVADYASLSALVVTTVNLVATIPFGRTSELARASHDVERPAISELLDAVWPP